MAFHLRLKNAAPAGDDRAAYANAAQLPSQGWGTPTSLINPSGRARSQRSTYAAEMAPVNALVEEAFSRDIYCVNDAGEKIDMRTLPIMRVLSRPNASMSMLAFLRTLFAGFLTEPEINALCWHEQGGRLIPGAPAGGFRPGTLKAMTILPSGSRYNLLGEERFRVMMQDGGRTDVGAETVIRLKYSLLPTDGYSGVSPGSASRMAAQTLSDLGIYTDTIFTNGGTPTTLVRVRARDEAEFQTQVARYQAATRGADKAHSTIFAKVTAEGLGGDGTPPIDVSPIAMTNKDLDIGTISDFAQRQVDSAQGVSPIIYGDASSTTYQNQELVERKFYKTVESRLAWFLTCLETELRRVCGDIGCHFAFDSPVAEITQRRVDLAAANKDNTGSFLKLLSTGYTPHQAAAMLELPGWAMDPQGQADARAQQTLTAVTSSPTENAATGSGTRALDRLDDADGRVEDLLIRLSRELVSDKATGVANDAASVDSMTDAQQGLVQTYETLLAAILVEVMSRGGAVSDRQLAQIIKDVTVSMSYVPSPATVQYITDRIHDVTDHFASDVVAAAGAAGAAFDIEGRAHLIAIQEVKAAFDRGQLDAAQQVADILQRQGDPRRLMKVWKTTSSRPCPFCEDHDGQVVDLETAWSMAGAPSEDPRYADGGTPDAHPGCRCVFEWRVA